MGLGNFLSGMETEKQGRHNRQFSSLGNFLSGMETPYLSPPRGGFHPPWKLP